MNTISSVVPPAPPQPSTREPDPSTSEYDNPIDRAMLFGTKVLVFGCLAFLLVVIAGVVLGLAADDY